MGQPNPPEGYDSWIAWCLELLSRFDYTDEWASWIYNAKSELAELREKANDETAS